MLCVCLNCLVLLELNFCAYYLAECFQPTVTNDRAMRDDECTFYVQFTHKLHGTDGFTKTHLGVPEILAIFSKNGILIFPFSSTSFTEMLLRMVDCIPLFRTKIYLVVRKQTILHASLNIFEC